MKSPPHPFPIPTRQLEEYLSELESITISFEDGQKLDFAEAALLIQGSACIYSKKVEHLYTLVYNTLNQVVEKKRNAREGDEVEAGGLGAGAAEDCDDDEDAFLALDGALKEASSIDLPVAREVDFVGRAAAVAADTRAITLASAPLALRPRGSADRDEDGACKMQACSLHPSGALLLPHTHVPAHVLATLPSPAPLTVEAPDPEWTAALAASGASDVGMEDATAGADDDDSGGAADFPDDERGDEWDDGEWHEALTATAPPMETSGGTNEDVLAAEEEAPPPSPSPAATRRAAAATGGVAIGGGERAAANGASFDPWTPLDPHDPSGAAKRPFRRGKTYRVPSAWATADVEADVSDAAAQEEGVATDKENASAHNAAGSLLLRLGLLSQSSRPVQGAAGAASPTSVLVPLRTPLWEQFGELHTAAARRRATARRLRQKAAATRQHLPSADVDAAEVEADAMMPPPGEGDGYAANPSARGDGGDGGEFGEDEAYGRLEMSYDDDSGAFGFDDDDDDGDGGGSTCVAAASEAALSRGGVGSLAHSSYEEMCRHHVEACLEASACYQEDYELHRRVAEWQAKVEPLLDDEARRADFDISKYAERLLAGFDADFEPAAPRSKAAKHAPDASEHGQTSRPFEQLVGSSDNYEVCRMFLAALQLTNQGNVELATQGSLEAGDLTLSVNLLSRERRAIEL